MILQNWWFTTLLGIEAPIQPPLQSDIEADVLIIGAGVAGLSPALAFVGKGLKVVLLDQNICGGSSTGKSAGFLTPDSELELSQLVRRFGIQGAKDLWDVPVLGIEIMKSTIKKYSISCDFNVQDSLFLGIGSSGESDVREEFESRKSLGYSQSLYSKEELKKVLGSDYFSSAVRYPETYGINALLFAQGIKRALLDNGIQIFEASEIRSIKGHRAETHLGSVTAQNIILCADKLKPGFSRYSKNIFHAQTFLSVSEPLKSHEIKALFPDKPMQCWDSSLVYSYFRLLGDGRLLLGGGSMLTTFSVNDVTSPRIISKIIRSFKKRFPALKNLEFIQYWPGRIDTTRDLLPTVGRDRESPWIHFVLGCVGLPWATFCGNFAAKHVLNDQSEDTKYYHYFKADRNFLMPLWTEQAIGKQLVFSLNNAWSKYYQVDRP